MTHFGNDKCNQNLFKNFWDLKSEVTEKIHQKTHGIFLEISFR